MWPNGWLPHGSGKSPNDNPRVNFQKKYIEKDLADLPNPAGPCKIWWPTIRYRTLLNLPEKNISNIHIVTTNTQKGEVRGLNPETSPLFYNHNTLIYLYKISTMLDGGMRGFTPK
jgi:hypothetical protein